MSSEIKNVIVVGAGGNLGPTVLKTLLEESKFNVTVLSRLDSKTTFPPNAKVVRADYSSIESLKSAFEGQDAVLSLIASYAIGDQKNLIDAAIAAGVKRFLPSEYGSNTRNEELLQLVPIFKGKFDTVQYLKSKESEISWSSVITGPFFDWGLEHGFFGFNLSTKTVNLVDEGKAHFTSTTLHQIGLAIIKILEDPAQSKNQYVFVASFNPSQAEILSVVEKITGAKWTVDHVTSEDLATTGGEKLKKQDFSGILDLLRAGALGKKGLGDSRPEGLWNDKLGLPKEDFEEVIKDVVKRAS